MVDFHPVKTFPFVGKKRAKYCLEQWFRLNWEVADPSFDRPTIQAVIKWPICSATKTGFGFIGMLLRVDF